MAEYVNEIKELPGDLLGGASGEKRLFNVQFLGKENNPEFPYTVANEIVATHVGIALGLNLPTVLTHCVDEMTLALIQMVERDVGMQSPPPVTSQVLEAYVAEHPDEIHGAIIFDLFVANNDRAFSIRRNLFLDTDGRLRLYDQGNACFYRPRPRAGIKAGVPRLNAVEKDLGKMFDMAHKKNTYWEFLRDWDLVRKWCDRIKALPDFLIQACVDRIPSSLSSPNPAEREQLCAFLCKRREYLYDHIAKHQSVFFRLPKN